MFKKRQITISRCLKIAMMFVFVVSAIGLNAQSCYAEENVFEVTPRYKLVSKETEIQNGEMCTIYIYQDLENTKNYKKENNETVYQEEYEYFMSFGSPKSSGSEDVGLISYAVHATFEYNYSSYNMGGNLYYRLNSLKCKNITLERGCTYVKTRLDIYNNGFNDTNIISGQSSSLTSTAYTTGTLYGNSSWTPSVSYDTTSGLTATMFSGRIYITRGTGSYDGTWSRSF